MESAYKPIEGNAKIWVLKIWGTLWKVMNDFVFTETPLNPHSAISCAKIRAAN